MVQRPGDGVAFLFTDIVGSTRLWAERPEAMARAVERHDALLHDAVGAGGGRVYKVVGDGAQAVFPDAAAALAAAVALRRSLDEVVVDGDPPEPLRVRFSLHAATATPDATGDYRTPALNLAGRLLDLAAGGQILASAPFVALLDPTLPAAAALRDLGAVRLRGMPAPERIADIVDPTRAPTFEERWPMSGNLPLAPGSIVGREPEVARHRLLLRSGETRLLTLTGPGGVGKTRLGLEIAAGLGDVFPDGVWFIDLAPLRDAAEIVGAIALVVGAPETQEADPTGRVVTAMRGRSALVVLDNVEHLLPAAAGVVADLLARLPGPTLLATSREPLAIRAERVREVAPLPTAAGDAPLGPGDRPLAPAVRLLVERRQAIAPEETPTSAAAPTLAAICARLDGLPLAIELAAARVSLTDPAPTLWALEERLASLAGGARDLPERQRTLMATIAWSCERLPGAEAAAFRALGVVTASLAREAATAVAACDDAAIDALVRRSLLAASPGAAGAGARVRMLETVRAYAGAIATDAEAAAARDRLAAWTERRFLPFLDAPPDEPLAQLAVEEPHLEASLEWLLATGRAPAAVRLGVAAFWFWQLAGGRMRRGAEWLERLLRVGNAAAVEPGLLADAYLALAQCQYPTGGGPLVEASYRACEAAMVAAGPDERFVEHRRVLIIDALYRGRARDAVRRARELDREAWATLPEGRRPVFLYTLVTTGLAAGDDDLVADAFARDDRLQGGAAETWTADEMIQFRAEQAWLAGRLEEAVARYEAAAERYRQHGDAFGEVFAAIDLLFLRADGEARLLADLLATAEARAADMDDLVLAADLDCARAVVAVRQGDAAAAAGCGQRSLALAIRLPMMLSRLRAIAWIAQAARIAGDDVAAAWLLGGSDALRSRAGFAPRLGDSPLLATHRGAVMEDAGAAAAYAAGWAATGDEIDARALAWRPAVTGRG